MTKKQVVITGLGMVSPLGLDVDTSWKNAIAGVSGIRALHLGDDFRAKVAGKINGFDVSVYMNAKDARRYDLFIQYGVAAAAQALFHAGLTDDINGKITTDPTRAGAIIGSGIGGVDLIAQNVQKLADGGARHISPLFVPAAIVNMAAGQVAIRHHLQGPNLATATACSSSAHAIGLAARMIAYGDADVMVAGGCEYASTPLGIGGFSAMQALSPNASPVHASRPFDSQRDGFVLSDGAGAIVLESLEHATARGANILAKFSGFGMSDDASHITAPPKDGEGAARAMRAALKDADLSPNQIDYINAHGTSTPVGDAAESAAINAVFDHAPYVSSTKSMTGHLLGAAGAVEAIFSILALKHGVLPPTINLDNIDPTCALNHIANTAKRADIYHALSNSFGFGGTNVSLIFSHFD